MPVMDFSPDTGHTPGFRYSARFVQRPVTTISIDPDHAAVTSQISLWMSLFWPGCTRTIPPEASPNWPRAQTPNRQCY